MDEDCPRCIGTLDEGICSHCRYGDEPATPSLVAGSIGRGLIDAAAAYHGRLEQLWVETVDPGPWDD